jgi:arabinosaccharide transport system substrate-binding protein
MLTKSVRYLRILVMVVVLGMVVAACGGETGSDTTGAPDAPGETEAPGDEEPSSGGEVVDLTFWTFVQAHADFIESQAAEYNASQSEVEIRIESTSIDWDDMHNRLLIALQSGTGAPDLVDVEISRFGPFSRGEVQFHPLTDIVERNSENLVSERLAPYTVDGVPYGIDYHLGAYLMYYNTEITDAAGVDIDAIQTWDDYIEAGLKVKEEVGVPMTTIETSAGFSLNGLMLLNGGGRYDADNNRILEDPANIEAAEFIQSLIFEHEIAVVAPGTEHHAVEFFESFNAGESASFWMPQWYMIRFPENMPDLEGKIKVRPLPAFEPGGAVTTMGGGTGTAITLQIDPDKVEVAKDFLEFAKLTYDAQVKLWTVLGFDPFWLEVYDDPALAEPDPWFGNEPVMANIKDMLDRLIPEYTGPHYAEISTRMGDVMAFELFEEQRDAAEVFAEAEAEIAGME